MNNSDASFKFDPAKLADIERAKITHVALIGWLGSGKSTFLRYADIKAILRTKRWDLSNATWDDIKRTRISMKEARSGAFPSGTKADERFHHFYLCSPRNPGFWGHKLRILHFLDVAGGLFDPDSYTYDLINLRPEDIYQDYINTCDAIMIFFDSYKIRSDETHVAEFTEILRIIVEALLLGRRSSAPKASFFCLTKLDIFPYYEWDTIEKFKKLRDRLLGLEGERSYDLRLVIDRYKRRWPNSTWWAISSIGYLDEAKTISRWIEEEDRIIDPQNVEPIGVASLLEELLDRTR